MPIAYSLKYLKDNTNAKLGYTTEYSVEECTTSKYPSQDVSLNNKNGFLGVTMRFRIDYKLNGSAKSISSGDIKTNTKKVKAIPAGAYDIRITIEYKDGFKWKFLADANYSKPTEVCFESTQSFATVRIKQVGC